MFKEERFDNSTFSLFNNEIVNKTKNHIFMTMNTLNVKNTFENHIRQKIIKFERWAGFDLSFGSAVVGIKL